MSYVTLSQVRPRRAKIISKRIHIGSGDAGIKKTVSIIKRVIRNYSKKPLWRSLAVKITNGARQRDFRAEAEKIFNFVRDRIRFVKDIEGVETVQTPDVTLFDLKAGDCDDFAVLLGTLLTAIGHKIRLKVISNVPQRGFKKPPFTHIYLQDFIGGKWVSLDASDKRYKFGWQYPKPTRSGLMEV